MHTKWLFIAFFPPTTLPHLNNVFVVYLSHGYLVSGLYVPLLHLSSLISMLWSIHVALAAFVKLLACILFYSFAVICAVLAVPASLQLWLLVFVALPQLVSVWVLALCIWERQTPTEDEVSIWQQNMYDCNNLLSTERQL
jgi:hypothetical protein